MEPERGFEPRFTRYEWVVLAKLDHHGEQQQMVGVLRIELSPRVPKTRMRPLHHTPKLVVAPLRVEPSPPAFQTGARTRYAREPQNLERSTGFEPVLKEWHSSVLAATLTPLKALTATTGTR